MNPALRPLIFLFVLTMGLTAAPEADAAKRQVPYGFHGVMYDGDVLNASASQRKAQWAIMAKTGVESARTVVSWARTQPTADGPLDFTEADSNVKLASQHGIVLLPVVLYTPGWAARDATSPGPVAANPADYASFMRQLVQRYGPSGTFWAQNPNVPKRPIRDWQIWNEMHFDIYWDVPGDDKTTWAREYAALLRETTPAIKAADPGARVVLGGLADFSWENLQLLYQHGAKGFFDVAALHIFTSRPDYVIDGALRMRGVLKRNGDSKMPLWVTEVTFPAAKGLAKLEHAWQREWVENPRTAAEELTQLYALGAKYRRSLRLERIYWVTWAAPYRSNYLFLYTGLMRYRGGAFKPTPFLDVYKTSARRYQGCAKTSKGTCR
jgi:hypothetical protein